MQKQSGRPVSGTPRPGVNGFFPAAGRIPLRPVSAHPRRVRRELTGLDAARRLREELNRAAEGGRGFPAGSARKEKTGRKAQ